MAGRRSSELKDIEEFYKRSTLRQGNPSLCQGAIEEERGGTNGGQWVGNCGYVALFDAETLGIRGVWAQEKNR